MDSSDVIKIFDVVQLKEEYVEFEAYWNDNIEKIRNDCGKKYYVSSNYDGWDDDHIYKNLDTLLIELGAERNEWIMMWFSW